MSEDIGFQGFDDLDEFDSAPVQVELPSTIEAASKNKSVSADPRSVTRAKAAAGREKKREANLAAFEAQHPDFAGWWRDTDFAFAISLREAARSYGKLSDAQLASGLKCIATFKAIQEERKKREAAEVERMKSMPVLDMSAVTTAMNRALQNGIKRPKMRLLAGDSGFVLSFAAEKSKWAGSLYLKDTSGDYLGRITSGKFYRSRDVSNELEAAILLSCRAPEESAVAYGRKTGSCSCCGRELTNHESIEAGIGPICQGNFFG